MKLHFFIFTVWTSLNIYVFTDLILFAQLQESWKRVGNAANFHWLEIKYYLATAFRSLFLCCGSSAKSLQGTPGDSCSPRVLAGMSYCCRLSSCSWSWFRFLWTLLVLLQGGGSSGWKKDREMNQTNKIPSKPVFLPLLPHRSLTHPQVKNLLGTAHSHFSDEDVCKTAFCHT